VLMLEAVGMNYLGRESALPLQRRSSSSGPSVHRDGVGAPGSAFWGGVDVDGGAPNGDTSGTHTGIRSASGGGSGSNGGPHSGSGSGPSSDLGFGGPRDGG
jgi:hypothetical protein